MDPDEVDAEQILADVAGALVERETGRSQSYSSEVREVEDITYLMPGVWQSIVNSLTSLDQSLAPHDEFVVGEPEGGGPSRRVKDSLKDLVRKSIFWYVNPIVAQLHRVQASSSRALHDIADEVKTIDDQLEVMQREDLHGRLRALETEMFGERIARLERASRSGQGQPPAAQAAQPGQAPAPVANEAPFRFDYFWFEGIHRGDRDTIKTRQRQYLEFFGGCSNVLDIGCGRGEFVELLAENGIGGYGVEIEADAVRLSVEAGLDVRQADAFEHLAGLDDDSLDGIFLSQVAEHLTPAQLVELVGLAWRKMKPGANVVIETPNPQCLLIFASFFYADLSHVQPVHPETMKFLLASAGFKDADIKLTNPVPRNMRLGKITVPDRLPGETWVDELNANVEKLNSVLFGYLDYAAVARK